MSTNWMTAANVFEMVEGAKGVLAHLKKKFDADWERDPSWACRSHSTQMAKAAAHADAWAEAGKIITTARAKGIDDAEAMETVKKLALTNILRHSADDNERTHEIHRRTAWVEVAQGVGMPSAL